MFRPIRRKKREIPLEAAISLLEHERRGVLAMTGEDGYPYAVPLNFRYLKDENKIIFHSAKAGYKTECLTANPKVCFTVYGNVTVKDEPWAPNVQSAVIFGRCKPVEDRDRTLALVRLLAEKYYPNTALIDEEIAASGAAVRIYEIEIDHISGKEITER